MIPFKHIYFLIYLLVPFFGISQISQEANFIQIEAMVEPIAASSSIKGTVKASFQVEQETDSVYLDAIQMNVTQTALEGVQVKADDKKIWLTGRFLPKQTYTAFFTYEATPKQTLYFTGDQIWTQGQGKYTSHWLPSIDNMNDKIEFDLTVVSEVEQVVISNGRLISSDTIHNKKYWKFDMKQPMASYLVAFALGDYDKEVRASASGVPIELYFTPDGKTKVEPTYRYTTEIFDFLEEEIGVPYPWQNYKQVPVRDFLYAGMENTTATIFSEAFVVDSIGFTDRNYVNVNAHELAHQWFGNLVTETEGTHHWLQEGFATYYALQAERMLFGEDYYYWKIYQSAEQLKELSDAGKGQVLLNAKASSLTFYEKGAWALHILKEQIGDEAFHLAMKNYLEKYQFSNVTTQNFVEEVRAVSSVPIANWEADWLEQSAFKAEQAYQSLRKSDFMDRYFEVSRLASLSFSDKEGALSIALFEPNDFIGQEAVYQLLEEPISETLPYYKKALASNNVYVRQAVATTLSKVPKDLQTEYESLLQDASYATREAALYNLWINFPENREDYLKVTKEMIGFQNKNLRQLWLVLAMVTPEFEPTNSVQFANELKQYASAEYSFEIREIALGYITELQLWDTTTLKNLVNSCVHHNWRFRSGARQLLDSVLNEPLLKTKLAALLPMLPEAEQSFLNKKITQ